MGFFNRVNRHKVHTPCKAARPKHLLPIFQGAQKVLSESQLYFILAGHFEATAVAAAISTASAFKYS